MDAKTYYFTDAQIEEIIGRLFERPRTFNLLRLLEQQYKNNKLEDKEIEDTLLEE